MVCVLEEYIALFPLVKLCKCIEVFLLNWLESTTTTTITLADNDNI